MNKCFRITHTLTGESQVILLSSANIAQATLTSCGGHFTPPHFRRPQIHSLTSAAASAGALNRQLLPWFCSGLANDDMRLGRRRVRRAARFPNVQAAALVSCGSRNM
jgi:hypothetical protein